MSRFLEIRRVLGLTQTEMADVLGCGQANVSFLDRGQTITPDSARKILDAAAALGVRLTWEHIFGAAVLPPPRVTGARRLPAQDWRRIGAELRERGWSAVHLAARYGVGVSQVSDLFRGEIPDPPYALGVALINLHGSGEKASAARAA